MKKRAIRPKLNECSLLDLKRWFADYFKLMNCDVKPITDLALVAIRWLDQGNVIDYPDVDVVKQKPFSIGDVEDAIRLRRRNIEHVIELNNDRMRRVNKPMPKRVTRDRVKYILFWMVHCGILDVATRCHNDTGQWSRYDNVNPGKRRPSYVFWLREVPNRFTLHPRRVYRILWNINDPHEYNPSKPFSLKPFSLKPVRIVPPSFNGDDLLPDLPEAPEFGMTAEDCNLEYESEQQKKRHPEKITHPYCVKPPRVYSSYKGKIRSSRPVQPSLFNGNKHTLDTLKSELEMKDARAVAECNKAIRKFNNAHRSAVYEDGKLFVAMRLTREQAMVFFRVAPHWLIK